MECLIFEESPDGATNQQRTNPMAVMDAYTYHSTSWLDIMGHRINILLS